ncbi:serine hydrolase domain-containing protein [Aquabacterium humicola]|uniref:serine hydrolase domain-containing protein n=1 Tax=Aquabacterium humicola TaxID=3237377 RepID=UPI0025436821|nr:serine hydrolase [Rubrivivax pictus]
MRHLRRIVCAALVLGLAAGGLVAASDAVYPAAQWTEVDPAAKGWSAEKLQQADELARQLRSAAYLVVHEGVIVHRFGDIERPLDVASVRKSLLSLLIGMQTGRGGIDLDKSLGELGIDDKAGLTADEKRATVRQLMQARSGVYLPAANETPDMARQRPERGSHAPGTFWYYNNWDFNVLGTVYQRATGRTVFEGLEAELAQPLGFQDLQPAKHFRFNRIDASEHPAYMMWLSARDLARIGLLVSRQGRWGPRQIVAPEWIAESTRAVTTFPPGGAYGYMWWTRPAFGNVWAEGSRGQFLLINAARDLVVVHRVGWGLFDGPGVDAEQFTALYRRILAAAPWRRDTPAAPKAP